jgi:signal transduction histidine kinase
MLSYPVDVNLLEYLTNIALLIGVWWLGRGLRLRRAYLAELEDRAQRLERLREGDARTARVEERTRIARELHDVVAHHVSVMTVQAGAARRVLDRDPDCAREAMSTIEGLGRTALSEMRRIVGVLRTERDPEHTGRELAPQPGLHDIGGLIDRVRETGLMVQLWIEGEPRTLSPGVDLAVYRLVQEALTNTLKHAGPQARAWVRIHYAAQGVNVEIEDDGRGAAAGLPGNGDSPGHGLVGMRERVALYGGELRIGPRSGGGFEVRARFPLGA